LLTTAPPVRASPSEPKVTELEDRSEVTCKAPL
jgi:hypothetical protein